MDSIQRQFMQMQLAVLFEQMRIIRELMGNMEMRLEEIDYECDEPLDFKVGFDWDDNIDLGDCDCPECRDDRSYRMD